MTWAWIVICTVLFFIGFFSGRYFRGTKDQRHIGTLIIDVTDGGIYTVFDTDPKTLKQGDLVALDILFADVKKSQQNQGA